MYALLNFLAWFYEMNIDHIKFPTSFLCKKVKWLTSFIAPRTCKGFSFGSRKRPLVAKSASCLASFSSFYSSNKPYAQFLNLYKIPTLTQSTQLAQEKPAKHSFSVSASQQYLITFFYIVQYLLFSKMHILQIHIDTMRDFKVFIAVLLIMSRHFHG